MTVMPLALFFSDSALNASEANAYRIKREESGSFESDAEPRSREWQPGVHGWKIETIDCPAFFQHEVDGFGAIRVGPRCVDDEIPYAL